MKGNITVKKDPVFSSREAAEMLHISKSTLYELTRRGEINFYRVGRNIRFSEEDIEAYLLRSHQRQESFVEKNFAEPKLMFSPSPEPDSIVLCGRDIILDVLSNYMRLNGVPTLRAYIGSFDSLSSPYTTIKCRSLLSHLRAGDTGEYDVPDVRRLLPGIPAVIIHLTDRMQGFYVAEGISFLKNIFGFDDLKREDVVMINREKGAGSRVLLEPRAPCACSVSSEVRLRATTTKHPLI